jgi:hypothetical protein
MSEIQIISVRELSAAQKEEVYRLWNAEYPVNIALNTMADLDDYLQRMNQPVHFFASKQGRTLAWASLFTRDNLQWFGIIVGRNEQGTGTGSLLLHCLKQYTTELYGWATDHERYKKNDGSVYSSPIGFYLKHGFTLLTERLETDQLSAVKIYWKAP